MAKGRKPLSDDQKRLRGTDQPCRPEEALPAYKERWTIETMFKGLKSIGFNIEDTHMVHINRIEQLFGVVIIAYT